MNIHHSKNVDQPLFDAVKQSLSLGVKYKEICTKYGIGKTTVQNVHKCKDWRGYLAFLRDYRERRKEREAAVIDEKTGMPAGLVRQIKRENKRLNRPSPSPKPKPAEPPTFDQVEVLGRGMIAESRVEVLQQEKEELVAYFRRKIDKLNIIILSLTAIIIGIILGAIYK
jgi:hypothetical protein